MKTKDPILTWLLEGDPAIRWQVLRDLCSADEAKFLRERKKIASEGWGARLLARQAASGLWGGGLYGPKWISTTYTMLLLRQLGLPADHPQALKACKLLLDEGCYHDGGINFFAAMQHSETCVTGMVLAILAYFDFPDARMEKMVEHLLLQQMPDGGWNCESYRGATHSSFHTTISVLEGLREYEKRHPSESVARSQESGAEFLLVHKLFRSHRNGAVVDPKMTRFSFPPRWRYDIMRALDYFQACRLARDPRMDEAIAIIKKKRSADGTWVLQSKHPGRTFFEMEKIGKPSRWNTLRALRILQWYERDE
ncbi:hypothetical protein HUU40_29935 [candidate division KSB1 bacterium]|nr:hypothetical protein [candidate division KSB1 bacterium]